MNISDFKTTWITQKIEEDTVKYAEWFGTYLCDITPDKRLGRLAMTTSQIRNVFGEIKRIQAKGYESEKSAFLLLRPKIAYAEARVIAKSGKSRISDFRQVLEKAHIVVNSNETFQNFVDFMEAILAYHKAAGGRD